MIDELIVGVLDDMCYDVRLKVEQQEALLKLVEGKHVIAFLPTGFGKNLIYTLFPIIKRKLTGKRQTVLVISPLRALMLDQQTIMKTHRIKAQCIIKDMPKESIQVDLTFRPDYRKVAELVTNLQHIPSLLLTATATEKVEQDLRTLPPLPTGDTHTIARLPDRPNTYIHMEKCTEKYDKVLAWLPQHVMSRKEKSRKIVVYCQNMRDCQKFLCGSWKKIDDRLVEMFHSRTDKVSVARILEDFVKLHLSSYI